ncbi:MAG: WD40 repeat domain-containing protein, partial [Chloroherpetonaceae bacterium]|nr:WD40 repeat domain-containing protein [Chloroherpetonaceae bacterium]
HLTQASEGLATAYQRYLKIFPNDIQLALQMVGEECDKHIRRLNQQAQTAIDNVEGNRAREIYQVMQTVTGSFLTGLGVYAATVSYLLKNDTEELSELGPCLDWRLSLPIDQWRIKKVLADDLGLLLRVSLEEAGWAKKLEKALSLYQGAAKDEDFAKALTGLNELLDSGEAPHSDYLILHRIGLMHLYVPSLLDLAKAEAYLIKSAECVMEESDPQAKRLISALADYGAKGMTEELAFLMKRVAAESYFQAGIACLAQGEFYDAADIFSKSRELYPLPEAGYLQAKSMMLAGRDQEAAIILEQVIRQQRIYAFKAAIDLDIFQKPATQTALRKVRDEAFRETAVHIQKCRAEMVPNSQAAPILGEIEQRIKQRTYYAVLSGIDDLHRPRKWKVMPTIFELKRMIVGHTLRVNALAFSADSTMLASASWKVIISNAATAEEIQSLSGHSMKEFVNHVAFSPDGSKLATASSDMTSKIFDVKTGKELYALEGHKQSVNRVAFSPDGTKLATASSDKTIIVWDVRTGEKLKVLKGHEQSVTFVGFSPDGEFLVSSGVDAVIHYWDTQNWKKVKTLKGHTHNVTCAAFSADSKLMATSSWDKTVKLWRFKEGTEIKTLTGHANGVDSVAFNFDDKNLATTSYNRVSKICEIKLWDVDSGQEIQSLVGQFYAVAFSPDGSTMAVASGDKTVKLLSSPELTVDEFIALEREARREIEQARKAAQSQPTPNGQGKSPYPEERRSGRERRKVSFWLGEGDRRSGQDRRVNS